jgi:N-formylglutamate amidohydrolase
MSDSPAFSQFGAVSPCSPIVMSVPHAGRHYPAAMAAMARLGTARLQVLEDRHADQLVTLALATGRSAIIAHTARAWIDLNRDEREFDPLLIAAPLDHPPLVSAKVRGGLGVIPRRIAQGGDIWRCRIAPSDLGARITRHHRPYHDALHTMFLRARARFGIAILVDVHSMPPLPEQDGTPSAQIIVGDRFGKSSHDRFPACVQALAQDHGLVTATNHPYAGGYILDRHAQPGGNIHAIQIEIDRRLYLDPAFDQPGPGLIHMQNFIARLATTLEDEALGGRVATAAE